MILDGSADISLSETRTPANSKIAHHPFMGHAPSRFVRLLVSPTDSNVRIYQRVYEHSGTASDQAPRESAEEEASCDHPARLLVTSRGDSGGFLWRTGATVTGTVKGPDGAAFKGAFVQAQNTKTRITVNVLSDKDGRYHSTSLPAGEYNLRIRAVGYRSDPHNAVALTAEPENLLRLDPAGRAGALERSFVLSGRQSDARGQGQDCCIEQNCLECHAFQTQNGGGLARRRRLDQGRQPSCAT